MTETTEPIIDVRNEVRRSHSTFFLLLIFILVFHATLGAERVLIDVPSILTINLELLWFPNDQRASNLQIL